jgi:translation elongation factor EF-1alpha
MWLLKYLTSTLPCEAADCDVLNVDSTTCGFAEVMSKEIQTPEHAILALTIGVRQMICCCTRYDFRSGYGCFFMVLAY